MDKSEGGESGARQFLAMTALQLERHLAYDGGRNGIRQPWDVIELFSTDVSYDGCFGNSLRTPAAREQLFEDVESWMPRLIVVHLPDWTPGVSKLVLELVRRQRAEGREILNTCGPVAGTHGGILNVQTEAF